MRIGFFTRRKDACWWLRILNPMSKFNENGHQAIDELMEHELRCVCGYGPFEFQWDAPDQEVVCPRCKNTLMSRGDVKKWRENINVILNDSEILVFQRPVSLSHLRLIKKAKELGKAVIQDADDNYFDIPEWNNARSYHTERRGIIEASIRDVDAMTVTVPQLGQRYASLNKEFYVLRNCVDLEIMDVMPPLDGLRVYSFDAQKGTSVSLTKKEFLERRQGKKFVLWGGSATHSGDLNIIVNAARRVSRMHDVMFGFVAFVHRPLLTAIKPGNLFTFPVTGMQQYFSLYKAINPDIGICPVEAHKFNTEGKSELKAVELMGLGILPVMSNIPPYKGCSVSGVYAENSDMGWYNALTEAVQMSDDERNKRVLENRKHVEQNYDINTQWTEWIKVYEKVLDQKRR